MILLQCALITAITVSVLVRVLVGVLVSVIVDGGVSEPTLQDTQFADGDFKHKTSQVDTRPQLLPCQLHTLYRRGLYPCAVIREIMYSISSVVTLSWSLLNALLY